MFLVEKLTAKSGQPTLRVTIPGQRRVFLHSPYDPDREAKVWADNQAFKPNDLVIVYGLGLGYHLRALTERLGENNRTIVVEPNPKVLQMDRQEVRQLESLGVRVVQDCDQFETAFKTVSERWKDIFFTKLPSYAELYTEHYLQFAEKLRTLVASLMGDRFTELNQARLWQVNLIKNLKHLETSSVISTLFESFRNKPAIIVSAGPSLAESIDDLRRAKGKALVLSVGTVAKFLLSEGISPDLIISFDATKDNFTQHFKNWDFPNDIPLIFEPSINFHILDHYLGPKSVMLVHPNNRWLEEPLGLQIGLVETGPSVANVAFNLVLKLGANPIILVGQDLAFSKGLSHARGTHDRNFDYDYKAAPERLKEVPGLDGKRVTTSVKMLTYLRHLENQIASSGQDRKVINTSVAGAEIAGTQALSLANCLDRYCRQDLSSRIASVVKLASKPAAQAIPKLESYLAASRRRLVRLISECKENRTQREQLVAHYEKGKPTNVRKMQQKLRKSERSIQRHSEHLGLLHFLMDPLFRRFHNTKPGPDTPELERSQRLLRFYDELTDVAEYSLELLSETESDLVGLMVSSRGSPGSRSFVDSSSYNHRLIARGKVFLDNNRGPAGPGSIFIEGGELTTETDDVFQLGKLEQWTLSCWINVLTFPETLEHAFIFHQCSPIGQQTFKLTLRDKGVLQLHLSSDGTSVLMNQSESIRLKVGKWQHLRLSYDSCDYCVNVDDNVAIKMAGLGPVFSNLTDPHLCLAWLAAPITARFDEWILRSDSLNSTKQMRPWQAPAEKERSQG